MRSRRVTVRRRLREQRAHKRRVAFRLVQRVLAMVAGLLIVVPVLGQDPTPSPSPSDQPAPIASPSPAPTIWTVALDAGPSTVSTPEDLKPYATARLTVYGEPWLRWQVFARGDLDRTTDGSAPSIADFDSFASLEAWAGARYRVKNSPVSFGVVGAATWSRESAIKSPADPRLWTVEAIACIERFTWWPNGGLACAGVGKRGPVGSKGAVSLSITQPIKGDVSVTVDFDLPFEKLPLVAAALPGAIPASPTAEEIRRAAQKLPIAVKVGVLVRIKSIRF